MLEPEAMSEFEGVNTKEPLNAVVVGLAPSMFDYEQMNRAFRLLLKDNCRLIAIHKGRYYKKNDGLALGPGPFVETLTYATEKTVSSESCSLCSSNRPTAAHHRKAEYSLLPGGHRTAGAGARRPVRSARRVHDRRRRSRRRDRQPRGGTSRNSGQNGQIPKRFDPFSSLNRTFFQTTSCRCPKRSAWSARTSRRRSITFSGSGKTSD